MITEKQIEAKDIKRLLLRVYRRYNSGAITETQAYKEASLLNSILKVIIAENLSKQETKEELKGKPDWLK